MDADHYDIQDNIGGGECSAADCCRQASGGIFWCGDNSNDCNHPVDVTPNLSLRPSLLAAKEAIRVTVESRPPDG